MAPPEGSFRRWRKGRPFWGGLFLLLSALELFFSSNLNPGNFQVHLGPTGFLSYLIPAMMLLCGLLTWLSPGQRLFYGILGTLTAVYSLIGLNLGGFLLGLLLGVVGGALTVAWAPSPSEPAFPPSEPAFSPPEPVLDQEPEPEYEAQHSTPLPSLLTDTLPHSLRSPLHEEPSGAGSADDQRPPSEGGPLPQRRFISGFFALGLAGALVLAAIEHPTPASAAPCPSASASAPAASAPAASPSRGGSTGTNPPAASSSASAAPSPTPSPSGSPSSDGGGDLLGGIVDGITGIVTGIANGINGLINGNSAASPTPTPGAAAHPNAAATTKVTPAPPVPRASSTTSRRPAASASAGAPCSPSPSASASAPPKKAPADPGQPAVAPTPSILTADTQVMHQLTYDGVVDLPTKTPSGPGAIRVLKFSMDTTINTPFRLDTPGPFGTLRNDSTELTVSGDVSFYTTKFSANALGVLPQTYTPDSPPLLVPPEVFFTHCVIQLVYVKADKLTAKALDQHFVS
jgi:hypothetical protein